jgi:hypothetical protein
LLISEFGEVGKDGTLVSHAGGINPRASFRSEIGKKEAARYRAASD